MDITELGRQQKPVYERFSPYKVTLDSTGIQSRVDLGEIDGVPVIRKMSGTELPIEVINSFVETVPKYRESLIAAGLKLPDNFSVRASRGLEIIDKQVRGSDIDVMIKMSDPVAMACWKEMVDLICGANDGTNRSKAMIDAKPANFIKHEDTLYYIDLFPPMLRDEQGLITPWVQSVYKRDKRLMSFNFGDTRGQITKLLAGSRIAYPTMYENLEKWTLEAIEGKLPQQTEQYIKEQVAGNFPDMKIFYSGQDLSAKMDELMR